MSDERDLERQLAQMVDLFETLRDCTDPRARENIITNSEIPLILARELLERRAVESAPMKVWILETGVYEDKGVAGVYATAEAAMAAGGGEWSVRGDDAWHNDRDWEQAAAVSTFEIRSGVGA